jgi:hypothetical protein
VPRPHRRSSVRVFRIVPFMAVIALVAASLLGGGFVLYVLFQWTREMVRNRRP